jgi:hypothetical protein
MHLHHARIQRLSSPCPPNCPITSTSFRLSLPSSRADRNLSLLRLGNTNAGLGVCNDTPIVRVTIHSEREFKLQRIARGIENSLSRGWVSFTAVLDGMLCARAVVGELDCGLDIERSYEDGLLHRWSLLLPRLPFSLALIPSSTSIIRRNTPITQHDTSHLKPCSSSAFAYRVCSPENLCSAVQQA